MRGPCKSVAQIETVRLAIDFERDAARNRSGDNPVKVDLERFPLQQATTHRVTQDVYPWTVEGLENPFGRLRFALCVVGVDGCNHDVELREAIVGKIKRPIGEHITFDAR